MIFKSINVNMRLLKERGRLMFNIDIQKLIQNYS